MENLLAAENKALKGLYGKEIYITGDNAINKIMVRGGFEKKILIITMGEGYPVFDAAIEAMFQRMMINLKSNENEVGLVDCKEQDFDFSFLKKSLQPVAIISFGVKPESIGLNIETKKNSIINMYGLKYVYTDSFFELHKSDNKKKEVFPILIKIFSN